MLKQACQEAIVNGAMHASAIHGELLREKGHCKRVQLVAAGAKSPRSSWFLYIALSVGDLPGGDDCRGWGFPPQSRTTVKCMTKFAGKKTFNFSTCVKDLASNIPCWCQQYPFKMFAKSSSFWKFLCL